MGPGLGAFSLWDRLALTVARDAETVEGKFGYPSLKNSFSPEERAALRGARSFELISPPLFPRASEEGRDGFLAGPKVLCDNWTKIGGF